MRCEWKYYLVAVKLSVRYIFYGLTANEFMRDAFLLYVCTLNRTNDRDAFVSIYITLHVRTKKNFAISYL